MNAGRILKMLGFEKYIEEHKKKRGEAQRLYEKHLIDLLQNGDSDADFALNLIDSKENRIKILLEEACADDNPYALYTLAKIERHCFFHSEAKQKRIVFKLYYRGRKSRYHCLLAELGRCYLFAQGCRRNFRLARKYLERAVKCGSSYAAFYMGLLALYGDDAKRFSGVLRKEKDGVLLESPALYEDELLLNTDPAKYTEVIPWFKKASPYGAWVLGSMLKSIGDHKAAFRAFRTGYKFGWDCGASAGELALCYLLGNGIKQNIRKGYDILFENSFDTAEICMAVAAGKYGNIPPDPLKRFDEHGNIIETEQP